MSGMKPPEMSQFYAKLRERRVTTAILAVAIDVERPTLCRVLNGSRKRGFIWPRLAPLLRPDEIALLDVAHRSMWNKARVAKRPKWRGIPQTEAVC